MVPWCCAHNRGQGERSSTDVVGEGHSRSKAPQSKRSLLIGHPATSQTVFQHELTITKVVKTHLVTGPLSVELIALLHGWPENPAVGTNLGVLALGHVNSRCLVWFPHQVLIELQQTHSTLSHYQAIRVSSILVKQ